MSFERAKEMKEQQEAEEAKREQEERKLRQKNKQKNRSAYKQTPPSSSSFPSMTEDDLEELFEEVT